MTENDLDAASGNRHWRSDLRPVRVLIVEDDTTDRVLIKAMLDRSGHEISTVEAMSVAEALVQMAAGGIDCVLLGLHLPDADELAALARLTAAAPGTAVVVLTGADSSDLAVAAVAGGAQDYLVKGRLDASTLVRSVRYAVERQQIQNSLAAALLERTSAMDALAISEDRFRRAFEDAPIGMSLSTFDSDGERRVIAVNRGLTTILGCTPQELLGTVLLGRVHSDDVSTALAALSRLLDGDDPVSLELRAAREDGTDSWLKLIASIIRDGTGTPQQLLIQYEDITERRQAQEQLSEYSFVDALTQLPNRLLALDRIRQSLARAARTGRSVAVMYVDIDHFKVVNDSLGHGAGDELLRVVGARLPAAVRPEDTVARIGGDEFVICCDDLPPEPGAAQLEAVDIAERVRSHLERPLVIDGRDLFVTVSIGIAVSTNQRHTADELLRDADTALYRAKDNGRSRWEVFDDALRAEAVDRLETERALRHALEKVQLAVHYQPIVAMNTGSVVGAEALLRWQHPSAGLITPGEFIRIAEETGLVVPIGEWVLDQACATLARWRTPDNPLTMAVNVSAKQLLRSDLTATVAALCDQYQLKPDWLTLEVTERQLVDLVGSGLSELNNLADYGANISLDDFGTGFGSLTYLRSMPVHAVKIDLSFVAGMLTSATDLAIVESVIRLGTALGLDIVAEGVETQESADKLRALGCPHAQGWLYGHPVPADQLIALHPA